MEDKIYLPSETSSSDYVCGVEISYIIDSPSLSIYLYIYFLEF
jgi:hypothetical protein